MGTPFECTERACRFQFCSSQNLYFHLRGLSNAFFSDDDMKTGEARLQQRRLAGYNTNGDEFLTYGECEQNRTERDVGPTCSFSGLLQRFPVLFYCAATPEAARDQVKKAAETQPNGVPAKTDYGVLWAAGLLLLFFGAAWICSRFFRSTNKMIPLTLGASTLFGQTTS